jgi:ubiquinone/menaquinone biosynthesis C-methylase UbiE
MMASHSRQMEDDDDTKSLTDSITDYPTTWGRRYHKYKEGSYMFPNDDMESDRLNLQYQALKLLHGDRIFFAPLKDPKRILDIGTGTGIWPIEMSTFFPNARITGTDLSPIQPSLVPPKVSFEIQDCTELDWCRPLASLDYIHTAIMLGSLPSYSKLIKNARRYLRPGSGWLECHEMLPSIACDDNTVPPNWPFREWHDYLEAGTERLNTPRPIRVADKLATWMREAGFVDVHERVDKLPMNPWPKDPFLKHIGRLWEGNWLDGLSAFSYKLFGPDGLGWTQNELEVFLVDVRKCIKDRNVHAYQKMYVVYGRRPSEEEERALMKKPGKVASGKTSASGIKGKQKGVM